MSEIVKNYDSLKQISSRVDNVEEAKRIIDLLESVLKKHSNGYGLSAIQIGIPKNVSIVKYGKHDREFIHLINPEFIEKGEEFTFFGEGCLSFPEIYMETKRHKDFTIKNSVIDGNSFREDTLYFYYPEDDSDNKLESIAVEHEIDHLCGLTILDYGKPLVKPTPIINSQLKTGRNDPCPCGKKDSSGKILKYKKCCGK